MGMRGWMGWKETIGWDEMSKCVRELWHNVFVKTQTYSSVFPVAIEYFVLLIYRANLLYFYVTNLCSNSIANFKIFKSSLFLEIIII